MSAEEQPKEYNLKLNCKNAVVGHKSGANYHKTIRSNDDESTRQRWQDLDAAGG